MNNESILAEINQYSGLGKLSVFVGAGVSKLSGFPSWNDLVQCMAEEITYKSMEGDTGFSSEELLKIPQMYYIKMGEEAYKTKVKNGFNSAANPNEVHDLILSLHPNHILTTNYDTLLEDTAIKFGRNFSVLNSNQVVSKAETLNYIVKVHGDFSGHFVLKEQDYLDYENDYILIDNVVKTIFATNLVIFIGYSLNDYNIKLILNWVKRVQSDSFVKPVFIHTGDKLSNLEKSYQEGRGLEILDCNAYTDSTDYLVKYRSVLEGILKFNDTYDLQDLSQKLKYMYDKVLGIKNLNYVRREDFNRIFRGEYKLDDNWCIENKTINRTPIIDGNEIHVQNHERKSNYFEDFFEHEDEYMLINSEEYNIVKQFLFSAGVNGLSVQRGSISSDININNLAFCNQYDEMDIFCQSEYSDIRYNYKKAYYWAQLGEYDKSYLLYTEILSQAKQKKQWDIYYFSQINRFYLFMIIKQIMMQTTGIQGMFNYGRELNIYDAQFIKNIKYEMGNNQLEYQFSDLPYGFKCQYASLSDFSKRNCYIDKYYDLVKEKYEVEKSLQKEIIYFGLSAFDKIKLSMLETSKFLYENMILFDEFSENKLYIKNSLISWLKAYFKDVTKSHHEQMGFKSNTRLKFTLTDIILISKNFRKDDIDFLANEIDFRLIPFDEVKELEKYVKEQINIYKKIFVDPLTDDKFLLYTRHNEEIKSLLYISSYFVTDNECKLKVLQYIINICDVHFAVHDKIKLINKWLKFSNIFSVYQLIEKWLIQKIVAALDKKNVFEEIDDTFTDISMIAKLLLNISTKDQKYSVNISKLIIDNADNIASLKRCFSQLYLIVNDEAKSIIEPKFVIEDVFQLMQLGYADNIPPTCDKINVIESFFQKILTEMEKNKEAGIVKHTMPSEEEKIGQVAAYMFMQNFSMEFTDKYRDSCAEYNFLLCPENFFEDNFQVEWLFTYSDSLCMKLRKCEVQRQIVIHAIEKAVDKGIVNVTQIRRMFDIYRIMNVS